MNRTWALTLCLAIALQPVATLFGSSSGAIAHAKPVCDDQFHSFGPKVVSNLPDDLRLKFESLDPKVRARFQHRYLNRDRIRAHAETARLAALLLSEASYVPLKSLLKPEAERARSITDALQIRLNQEAQRARLENSLLSLGYKPESGRRQSLSRFQAAHFRQLESLKRFAVNSTATFFMGLPILMGRFQYQRFQLETPASRDPFVRELLEKEISALQEKIDANDPTLIKDIKRELAIELARRILIVGVFAILTNELLDFLFPTWVAAKAEFWNPTSETDRLALEETAIRNWQELYEAFSGEKLTIDSPIYQETKARISNASIEALKAHVHEGAALPE
jgi:hypothetical protein